MTSEIKKIFKLILIIFLAWVVVTYVPNTLLRNWLFILFVFAEFYLTAVTAMRFSKKREDLFVNVAIVGLFILGVASVILNRIGY